MVDLIASESFDPETFDDDFPEFSLEWRVKPDGVLSLAPETYSYLLAVGADMSSIGSVDSSASQFVPIQSIPARPHIRAYGSTGKIPKRKLTVVQGWNIQDEDLMGLAAFADGKLTIDSKGGGLWLLTMNLAWDSKDAHRDRAEIHLNGSQIVESSYGANVTVRLKDGDEVVLYGYQDNRSSVAPTSSAFSATRLSV